MKDYYKVLEVESTATIEQIKAQYRFLTHAWHPDKFPNNELKAKAEEKIKDINEAYSVLGDTTKRENYDRALRSYSSPPKPQSQESYSRPAATTSTQTTPKAQPKEYCQSCGLPVETRYVEFYENVGMIFARQHRAVKGKLCKPCIDYYFWNLTGKTMLVGWWSMSSVIITPFILLNNLFRFVFATGMKKPPVQIAPNPSPFWVFSAIGGFLLIGYFFFSMFSSASAQPTQTSYSSSPTSTPIPTRIPTKVKTPTAAASNCIQWSKVSDSMIGKKACVYGTIYKTRNVGESTFQVLFSNSDNSFFLASGVYYYEVGSGDCVVAEGVISRSGANVPYMNIDKALYKCESWMK